MNKNENFDDMKELFSKDITLPESLSKENIVQKIKDSSLVPQKKRNVKKFPKIVAAAAAFAVVAVGAFAAYEISAGIRRTVNYAPATAPNETVAETKADNTKTEEAQKVYRELDVGTEKVEMSKFKTEKDLDNYRKNAVAAYRKDNNGFKLYNKSVTFAAAVESADGTAMDAVSDDALSGAASAVSQSFGKTNTQVSGVDEADIVKTDGNFLYIISNNTLSVVDAGTMKLMSQTELKPSSKDRFAYMSDIFLNGNLLVVTGYETEKNSSVQEYYYYFDCINPYRTLNSLSVVFDITERDNIKEVRRVTQDGELEDSRMIGTYLYTVTRYSPDYKNDTAFYPKVNGEEVTCDEVYVDKSKTDHTVNTVVSCYNTADKDSEVKKVSVIADSNVVYCSNDTLYIACNSYEANKRSTVIHAFSLRDGKVSYKGSGNVPGTCDGQYMMDQSGKYFRIATTDYNVKSDLDVSSLYVLDENLRVIGKLENIAHDEQIKSVRFMGDTAYVVTFKNTDPLFAVDLSKPNAPKILGEVKLPGFSRYLHPLSGNLLVGIGYDGDEESADFSKIKISLFDVSDKKNPKELTSHIIKNAYCNVDSSDAKAFVTIDENTFGIPVIYEDISNDYYYLKPAFKTFSVKDGKFVEKNVYVHSSKEEDCYLFRGTFIGKYVYTISEDTVKQFDMESEKELASLVYQKEESVNETVTEYAVTAAPSEKAID